MSLSKKKYGVPVYEVKSGKPSWSNLYRMTLENVSRISLRTLHSTVKTRRERLSELRAYLISQLPSSILREILELCLTKDRFRCYHNPTDCQALDLWRVFYTPKYPDINIVHHEFAFPKTTNYPDIIQNLEKFLDLVIASSSAASNSQQQQQPTTSFKLELKQCEIGFLLQEKVIATFECLNSLRVIEIPGLGSDELLHVIATHCTKLEVLNLKGSREQVTDNGFKKFSEISQAAVTTLRKLDISRCTLTQQVFIALQRLVLLSELKISSSVLDEIHCSCEGQAILQTDSGETLRLDKVALPSVNVITVENDTFVQVSINKVMVYLRKAFPNARNIQLENCIACELHVTLTQHPTNITFMREHIHSLELISADYFNFPRLVYPSPNLESLTIEKPTNDVFNIDQENVPVFYGNTIPFINLKHLKLSRISLTNLTHFLSKSSNLIKFKVTNIGRRERPRWTDERIQQILTPESVPRLKEFHVSCLPNEGFSTGDSHRYLHLTKNTVQYLTENFVYLQRIAGIESWNPSQCNKESLNALLNAPATCGKFSITSSI